MSTGTTRDCTGAGVSRRTFLRLSGLLGIGAVSATVMPRPAGAVRFNRRQMKVSRDRVAMGTFVSMTLVHPSQDQAEEAMGQAFGEIDRLTGILNRFDSATALAALNHEGVLRDVPPELETVFQRSLLYHRLSRGTFDITVKPLVDLYKESFARGPERRPEGRKLEEALSLVGAEKLEFHGGTIRFRQPGMGITLDGIAKGYVVDCAAALLSRAGISNFLVNAGGDIRVKGSREDGKAWRVAVQDPQKRGRYPDVLELVEGAIATSGNYEIYYDREKMFHHIVDPRNGFSPMLSESVSVLAQTAMDADALSTSVFVMNPEFGLRFVESLPRCECLVVARNGRTLTSAGWNKRPQASGA